jgi:hypothetical protein
MGVALGLMFEKKLPEADEFSKFTDGKDLAGFMGVLDDICQERGLTAFSTFVPDFDGLEVEELEKLSENDFYFSCAKGLKVIGRLITALEGEPRWSKEIGKVRTKTVIACLRELERLLTIGKKKRTRFSLLYY